MAGCRNVRLIALSTTLLLVLAACGGESGSTTTSAGSADTTAAETTTTAAATTTTEAEADAFEELVAAAQAEGEVVFYGAQSSEIMEAYTAAFTEKYGIVVSWQRLPAGDAKARVDEEIAAGQLATDVLTLSSDPAWHNKMVDHLAEPDPEVLPALAAVPEELRHGTWVESYQAYYGFVYNTDEWGPDDIPTDLRDLVTKEGVAGRIGTTHPSASNFYATWHSVVYDLWGQESYEEFWQAFIQEQDGFISDSAAPLVQGVAAGELLFVGPTNYGQIGPLVAQGAPVEMVYLDPVLRVPGGMFVFKDAPHPNAAMLFLNWFLSEEGQTILCGAGECGSHLEIPGEVSLPDGIEPIEPDVARGAELGAEYVIPHFDTLVSSS